jgi:hypothetical protein
MRKIGLLVATIAGTAALCAACGGSAPAPAGGSHPSTADPHTASASTSGTGASLSFGAEPDVCKMVPLAAVQAVLGHAYNYAVESNNECIYSSTSSEDAVPYFISINRTAYSASGALIAGKAAPVPGPGHAAECGVGSAAGYSSLVGAIGSANVVNVFGPSCGIDTKLARAVYSALAS